MALPASTKVRDWCSREASAACLLLKRLWHGVVHLGLRDCDDTAASDWYKRFRPVKGANYGMALDYAEKRYHEEVQAFDGLDNKAEAMFKLNGVLATLLVAAVHEFSVPMSGSVRAAFVFFLAGMVYAALARAPVTQHTPLKISHLLDCFQDPKVLHPEKFDCHDADSLKALLAASYYCAVERTKTACEWKADKLLLITALTLVGVALTFPALI